jgi:hypothetical protein
VKPKQLLAAGIERGPKTTAVRDGKPVREDGRVLDVTNGIWSTGYRHDLSWIDLPIFGEDGKPIHERGVATAEPGLAFVGLPFQFAAASDVLPGVGRTHATSCSSLGSAHATGRGRGVAPHARARRVPLQPRTSHSAVDGMSELRRAEPRPREVLPELRNAADRPAEPAGEVRKTVSIVFCDVTGSTAMGEGLDPEPLRNVMTRYFDTMRASIERHGGTVRSSSATRSWAVFGIPQLHEDDAAGRGAADMQSTSPS